MHHASYIGNCWALIFDALLALRHGKE